MIATVLLERDAWFRLIFEQLKYCCLGSKNNPIFNSYSKCHFILEMLLGFYSLVLFFCFVFFSWIKHERVWGIVFSALEEPKTKVIHNCRKKITGKSLITVTIQFTTAFELHKVTSSRSGALVSFSKMIEIDSRIQKQLESKRNVV